MKEPNTWQSEFQKKLVYKVEDISLKVLVPTVPKILSFFPSNCIYYKILSLHKALCCSYDYTMAMLSEKGESLQWRKGCHYFADVKLLHSHDNTFKYGNLCTFSGLRCSMFLKNKPVFSRFIHHKTPKSIILAI